MKRREPRAFTPCSPCHRSCSPAHAALVAGYREERLRQEIEHDGLWDAYGTDEHRIWKENGNRLIGFKEWLISHAGEGRSWIDSEDETDPNSLSESLIDTGSVATQDCEGHVQDVSKKSTLGKYWSPKSVEERKLIAFHRSLRETTERERNGPEFAQRNG